MPLQGCIRLFSIFFNQWENMPGKVFSDGNFYPNRVTTIRPLDQIEQILKLSLNFDPLISVN